MPAAHQNSLNDVLERLRSWEADEAAEHKTPVPASPNISAAVKMELKPPSYGASTEQAIAAIVDNVSTELAHKLRDIRKALDRIEQTGLQSAANAKGTLTDHISVCIRLNAEIERMTTVVAQIEEVTGEK